MKACFALFLFFLVSSDSYTLKKRNTLSFQDETNLNEVLTGDFNGNDGKSDENNEQQPNDEVDLNKVLTGNVNPGTKIVETPPDTGTFWHITDLHLDSFYNLKASDATSICPSSNGQATINAGPFGDYRCDAPFRLVESSIDEMQRIQPNPDFIIWTGDDTLHTDDEQTYLSEEKVLQTIANITALIKDRFPSTAVYPALGNHDYHPKNQMPIGNSDLLNGITELWADWLGENEKYVFQDGGYYALVNSKKNNLQIVVLNTNLWYSSNKLINNTHDEDPGGQFAFLDSVLQRAVADQMKVYIIGHIPPGYFELVDYKYWLYPEYNTKYINMVKKYSHVITGQFFGHHHTDSFRIFEHNGQSVSTAFIAPGVSPWMTNLPGVKNGANNPGIRLYHYNENTFELRDYVQYYLDLEKANADNKADWKKEYTATDAYNLNDLSAASMDGLYKKIKEANLSCTTCEEYKIVQKYITYNAVSYDTGVECDEDCLRYHACAISELETEGYEACVTTGGATSFTLNRIWALLVLLVLLVTNWNCL